ncbi:hypothetical protein BDZ94DRAFT_1005303 [Collybia nuda]|uniref:NADH-ubiquinone oxidoreductase B15 subunit n=1 Tax=Collybia nuda TaxID=64659 RepID=A0A9P5XZF7_9AGAR|nr:hypothetical protein BDZ94DRAFT_1005303 [Collybia nuda]
MAVNREPHPLFNAAKLIFLFSAFVKEDPAIERFNRMREEAYLKFRWTKRTTRTAIIGFIVIPGAMYYLASQYTLKFNWTNPRGQMLTGSPMKRKFE